MPPPRDDAGAAPGPAAEQTLSRGDYLLGLNGLALLRQWPRGDRSVVARRRADTARVVETTSEGDNFERIELGLDEGYQRWAPTYDGPNPLVALEEAAVRPLLEALPVGRALDAACGTGRHAAYLLGLGHGVVGVDASAAMLEGASQNAPGADLRLGTLAALPCGEASVDLAICALALTHCADLGPPFRELARVVRPGGKVVVTDLHPFIVAIGGQAFFRDSNGRGAFARNHLHRHADYVEAATAASLVVERCLEPRIEEAHLGLGTNSLGEQALEAARDAVLGLPGALIWVFCRP